MKIYQRNKKLKTKYISTLFFAFLVTGSFAFYLLNFRYNSCKYSIIILDRCFHEKDTSMLNKYCNLDIFSDSVLSHLSQITEIQDSGYIILYHSLLNYKNKKNLNAFFYNTYNFLKESFGEVVYHKEKKENGISVLDVFYKPFPSTQNLKLELIFIKTNGIFQLQYIKNLKTFLISTKNK